MKKLLLALIILSVQFSSAHAQEELSEEVSTEAESGSADGAIAPDASDVPEESLYKNDADALMENKNPSANKIEEVINTPKPAEKLKSMMELDTLTPFSDIAVIQKRFLPKSQRFEFNPNLGMVTNNAFFMTTYFQARLAYAITEKWAVEATLASFFDQKYKVTEDLKDDANVATKSLLLPEMYYGVDIRWSPIYGKMGSFSEGIIPFDMYFSFGGGVMDTNQEDSPFAIHLGTGQIFGINKWMAFRWDLSGYFYSAETASANAADTTTKNSNSFTDIQLSLGMSFFFPDATYR